MSKKEETSIITTDNEFLPARKNMSGALAGIEGSRAVAEVQASLVIAKANPRSEVEAERAINNACKRPTLAKTAMYLFRRGTTNVTGPTIRLAEVMARAWGNINYGFREIGREDDCSEVEAFAHDLQTNTRVTRQFQVKHIRDTRSGGQAVTQERDKYELVANMAQRRVRACLLELIPGDIVEMAVEACEATLNGSIGDLKKAITDIVAAFDKLGVTQEEIEGYMQRKMSSLVPADIVNLRKIHTSIKTGIAPKEEFFREGDVDRLNERFSGKGKKASEKKPPKNTPPTDKKKDVPETPDDPPPPDEPPPHTDDEDPAPKAKEEGAEERVYPEPRGPGLMIACPDAAGMMVDSGKCKDKVCYNGCPAW